MSVVTGVVLVTSCAEDETTEDGPLVLEQRINAWLAERGFGALTRTEELFGGNKHPQICVLGGGYNYFPEDEFSEFVLSLPWSSPEEVTLLLNPEDGATRVFRPS